MAWTTPTTRSTSDLITASIWNTDLTDNLAYLKTSADRTAFALSVFPGSAAVTVGDGAVGVPIPAFLNGWNITAVLCTVEDKGVTGTTDVQVRRWRAGSAADVLSTKVTIGDEWFAADGVINASNDDLATGDIIYIDVDAVHSGTAPNGLSVVVTVESA